MSEHRQRQKQRVPTAVFIIAFIFVAIASYAGGVYHTQILAAVGPLFGFKAYSGTLDLSSVQTTYQQLKANFDGELDEKTLIDGANSGLVDAAGDKYTQFFNAKDSEAFNDELSGVVGGGVGLELSLRNDRITVVRALEGNPGSKAGILAGDIISAVNGDSTEGWSVDDAVTKIRGEAGTTVKLSVLRGEQKEDFTVTRAEISNPSVYSSVQDGIGILTISRFDSETGRLARDAAESMKSQSVKGVVLDLRSNGGGYLTAAQDVAGIWLDKKVVVTEKANGKVTDELFSSANPVFKDMPTVVLVNGGTASASEIVAGALLDYKVATLVGETTFGKGSVQQLIQLPRGAQLKVTIARWYTPQGKNISETGIEPTQAVERTSDDVNAGRDPQLDAAKGALLQ